MDGIIVAYAGVHQIFQIALTAYEMGRLDRFLCSICDAPGTLGSIASAVTGRENFVNRRCGAMSAAVIEEFPWPFLFSRLSSKISRSDPLFDWRRANTWFDRHVSRRLASFDSAVFVGVETCARDSFLNAKRQKMKTVLDCPQAHPVFLEKILSVAASDLGLLAPGPSDGPEMTRRKQEELELADFILVFSDVHRRSFAENGIPSDKLVQIPLWADLELWFPQTEFPTVRKGPLRVIFVGQVGLRKGVPYLLEACERLGSSIELTLVGPITGDIDRLLEKHRGKFKLSPPLHKSELRKLLWQSDLLVLPSLLDTFGFAAMEAMACGLPVIVSENCGVPVPDASWIVPTMDSSALAERIQKYVSNRSLCLDHGKLAREFAMQFTPRRYRDGLKGVFNRLLN
jgi:glycosyltransferase involved in cell wall biosynthesis